MYGFLLGLRNLRPSPGEALILANLDVLSLVGWGALPTRLMLRKAATPQTTRFPNRAAWNKAGACGRETAEGRRLR